MCFNACVLLRLLISRQPLLRNRTSLPRPCIHNLTSSSRAVMKAHVSHRLGLSHFPARFDAGIHAEPLRRSPFHARVSFSSRSGAHVLFRPARYSNQTDVFSPRRRRLSFEPITFMAQFIMVRVDVPRSLVVRSTRGADEPFPLTRLLSHF